MRLLYAIMQLVSFLGVSFSVSEEETKGAENEERQEENEEGDKDEDEVPLPRRRSLYLFLFMPFDAGPFQVCRQLQLKSMFVSKSLRFGRNTIFKFYMQSLFVLLRLGKLTCTTKFIGFFLLLKDTLFTELNSSVRFCHSEVL